MSRIVAEQLKRGIIFGDHANGEYIYLPGSEIGMDDPLCVLETPKVRQDLSLKQAVQAVLQLSLKPVEHHPIFGNKSC